MYFPKAILSANRQEISPDSPLNLTIRDGLGNPTNLPDDLQGAVFIIAPVGSVESPVVEGEIVLPASDGWTALLNGDGMVYRLEFVGGEAKLSSQFVKTPSHYADKITQTEHTGLQFIDLVLARLSVNVGSANQVNTAFQPVKFAGDANERLLATWDAGRAYELDPASLKVIAPLGLLEHWKSLIKLPITYPFKMLMSSAHPAFDPVTQELFTLNVVKSLSTVIGFARFFPFDTLRWVSNKCPHLHGFIKTLIKKIIAVETKGLSGWVNCLTKLLGIIGIGGEDDLYLLKWQGNEIVQKWQVLDADDNEPVKIAQSVHQMGISEDYIVLADTSFKIVLEDLLPAISPNLFKLSKLEGGLDKDRKKELRDLFDFLRPYLTHPQSKDTYVYIIKRSDLGSNSSVTAKKLTIEREIAHFLTDYENPGNKITIHAALNTATDPAEFIRYSDDSVFDGVTGELQNMAGMLNDALAINRPGFYVIDGETAQLEREDIFDDASDDDLRKTWYMGLYAYREQQTFEDIYWLSFGAWTNILSQFVYDMYEDYEYRQKPLEQISQDTENGVPGAINRVHIDRGAADNEVLNIVDSYEFPQGYFASSPQFVPRPGSTESTDGYMVCTIVHSDDYLSGGGDWSNNSEIWIFDAANLAAGPQYKLSSGQLNLGFTLHTTWLENAAEVPSRDYDIASDFGDLVEECKAWHSQEVGAEIDALFQQVYEDFNSDRKSS